MKKFSEVFRGNVRRFQALSTFRLLAINILDNKLPSFRGRKSLVKYKDQFLDLENEADKTEKYLQRAIKMFQRVDCAWGLGLTYFQTATLLLLKSELEQELE